jgi:ABC-type branched-subunit amino acid transport system ATPase component
VQRDENDGLAVDAVSVRFGGLVAVDDATLIAPQGQITGLIGPNGAGKTTTFNVCSGLTRPAAGHVLSPSARANRGLGRTFQRMELFESLSVLDNVALGREARLAGGNPLRQVVGRRADRSQALAAGDSALLRCGITDLAARRPGELSTGQRRLVELARVIAGDFRLLLLDEPSSGLDRGETKRFGEILRDLVADGLGILVVEHDMSLVLSICDYVYVLDFGKMIFEGTPSEVATSDVVRAAYLGSEEVAVSA